MARITQPNYSVRADEILADGEWHDGLEFMRDIERKILPGIAIRHNEKMRVRAALRRGSERAAEERQYALSDEAQKAAGKRSLSTILVHGRVRFGAWEVDPWPVPENGWKQGGWKLRRIIRHAPHALASRYGLAPETVRALILQEPAIPHDRRGPKLTIREEALPQLEGRIETYRSEAGERRRKASLEWVAAHAHDEPTHLSLRQLSKRDHIAPLAARKICEAHPELQWRRRGNATELPLEELPKWDKLVAEYLAGGAERRSAAARRRHARERCVNGTPR